MGPSDHVAGFGDEPGPVVEILYFDGCPNHEVARALVEQVGTELGIDPTIRCIEVPDAEAAERERFLGSPTIRVAGRDVEPGAEQRSEYGFTCRVFRTAAGLGPVPDREWIASALRQAVGRR